MKIKNYEEFLNEGLIKKGLATGVLAATLSLGIGSGFGYMRDKGAEPTDQVSSIKSEIPNTFDIDEKILSIGYKFWITNNKRENFGKIEQRMISFGKKFEYFDNTGKLDAIAKEEVFSLGAKIDIKDGNGNAIGSIKEEILESLENIANGQNIYSILDAEGRIVGKSKSDNIIKNNVEIYDNSDRLIASFHTPMASMGARWRCEILSTKIDKRLFIFIPAYISSKSSSKSSSNRNK